MCLCVCVCVCVLYSENVGECLVFKFIDVVREFLDLASSQSCISPDKTPVTGNNVDVR